MTFRAFREPMSEWHLGVWYCRRVFSIRLIKWAFVWDAR